MKVHVAVWEHKHGDDVRVFASAEGAGKWRREIAEDWWEDEMDGREKPEDSEAAADAYFAAMAERSGGNEYFTVRETEVEGLADAS